MNQSAAKNAIFFTSGLLIGGGVTYLVIKKRYRELAETEITSVKEAFETIVEQRTEKARRDWSTPTSESKDLYDQAVTIMGYKGDPGPQQAPNVEQVRIYTPDPTDHIIPPMEDYVPHGYIATPGDMNDSEQGPNPVRAYVIDVSDYFTNDNEYEQSTLALWVDDNVLVDERGHIVDDIEATVGVLNMVNLAGMPDESEMYIRNERISMDFEINRITGSYSKTVLDINPGTPAGRTSRNGS